jgi:methylglyoxal/glyoxal reductase
MCWFRLNKSVAQVMIRWSVQNGYITIPKSTKVERIVENAKVFDFTLSDDDLKVLVSKNIQR